MSVRGRAVPLLALVALVVEVAAHLLDFAFDDLRVRVLDASWQWSWSHVVATAAFASGAAVCAFAAWRLRGQGQSRRWALLSAPFAVLLADNLTRAHDAVPIWPLVVAPALTAVAIGVVRLARGTPAFGVALAGLAMLVLSFAIHILGHTLIHWAQWGPETWGYQIKVALKEGTELAGWVLLVPVLVRLALQPLPAAPWQPAAEAASG